MFDTGSGRARMSLDEVRERVEPLLAVAGEQLGAARQQWDEASADDLRVRLAGSLVGGLVLGRVVKRVAR